MDPDEMSNLYREPSIVASYQVRLLWQSDLNLFRRSLVFLAQLAKGNVSFCHHLASVVHRLFLIGRFLKNLL
jgi:hypothetical protein